MKFYWEKASPKTLEMKIPDYALDMHTTQGNKKGRHKNSLNGVNHFIKVGEYLENEHPLIEDKYKEEAHKVWRSGKK